VGNPSAWSSRGAFKLDTTAPDRPELVSPADGATTGKTPTLDWSDVTDVSTVHYQMQVDNDADFSSPVINKTWVSSSQYTVYSWQALPAGTYYWRVIAIDGAGNDNGWNSWSFVVDATPPDAPTLQSPANWKRINYSWPLDWSDVSDDSGVNYQLQIDDSPNFSSLLVDYTAIGTSTFTLSAEDGLADGGWYYWRVRAVDGVGNASAWTSRGAFKLDTTAPDLPELVSPGEGATTGKTPTLDWSDVTDISTVHYQLQVDNDSDFSSPVIYKTWVSVSEYTVAAWQALPAGTYYWRVIAIDGAGNDSGWTTAWSFTVEVT
jgi:predicted phage tail protein